MAAISTIFVMEEFLASKKKKKKKTTKGHCQQGCPTLHSHTKKNKYILYMPRQSANTKPQITITQVPTSFSMYIPKAAARPRTLGSVRFLSLQYPR